MVYLTYRCLTNSLSSNSTDHDGTLQDISCYEQYYYRSNHETKLLTTQSAIYFITQQKLVNKAVKYHRAEQRSYWYTVFYISLLSAAAHLWSETWTTHEGFRFSRFQDVLNSMEIALHALRGLSCELKLGVDKLFPSYRLAFLKPVCDWFCETYCSSSSYSHWIHTKPTWGLVSKSLN